MRLSHPIAIDFASLLASLAVRAWASVIDIRRFCDEPAAAPEVASRPHLYMTWHENIPLVTAVHARHAATLISQHRDGELIARTLRLLGGHSVRGSTTRGGIPALRKMLRLSRARHLAILPDGPRGPRRVLQSGAIYLASRAGIPLVAMGAGYSKCWRAGSWDRMAVPVPLSTVAVQFHRPIEVPPDANRDEIEVWRQRAQEAMDDAQARAERLARR